MNCKQHVRARDALVLSCQHFHILFLFSKKIYSILVIEIIFSISLSLAPILLYISSSNELFYILFNHLLSLSPFFSLFLFHFSPPLFSSPHFSPQPLSSSSHFSALSSLNSHRRRHTMHRPQRALSFPSLSRHGAGHQAVELRRPRRRAAAAAGSSASEPSARPSLRGGR